MLQAAEGEDLGDPALLDLLAAQAARIESAEAVLREIAGDGEKYPSGAYSNEMARAYFTQQKGDVGS